MFRRESTHFIDPFDSSLELGKTKVDLYGEYNRPVGLVRISVQLREQVSR